MPLYTADALVLRTYKLGEADRIVVFLTADRGKKRGVARSARRPQVAVRGGARAADARAGGVLREGDARAGGPELRRAAAVAAVGPGRMRWVTPATSPSCSTSGRRPTTPTRRCSGSGRRCSTRWPAAWASTALARYFEYWLLRLQGVYPPHLVCHRCGRRFTGEGEDGAWLSPLDSVLTCAPCADGAGGAPAGHVAVAGRAGVSGARADARAARPRGPVEAGRRAGRARDAAPRADGAAPRAGTAIASCVASDASADTDTVESQTSNALTFQDLIFKLSAVLGRQWLPDSAAAGPRSRRRHVASRDAAARARPGSTGASPTCSRRGGPTTDGSARTRTACSSTTSSR